MLQWLAQFLTAPIIGGFIEAYKAKLSADNTQDRTAADLAAKAIAAEIDARKSANAVIIAEQGSWYTAMIRPLLALPVIIYLWKGSSGTRYSALERPTPSAATSACGLE
jgi:hypothetical protein